MAFLSALPPSTVIPSDHMLCVIHLFLTSFDVMSLGSFGCFEFLNCLTQLYMETCVLVCVCVHAHLSLHEIVNVCVCVCVQ